MAAAAPMQPEGEKMADEPDNLVLEILREIRRDIARLDGKIDDVGAELRSEIHSLRADVAADLHALDAEHKQTREQIVGLRRAVVEYHCSAIGHGVLFSELEERVRRLEHHLKLPPSDAH